MLCDDVHETREINGLWMIQTIGLGQYGYTVDIC